MVHQYEKLSSLAPVGITHTQVEHSGVNVRSIGVVDRVGRSGQDDSFGLPGKIRDLLGAGEHFGVDIELTETADDQVRELGTIRQVSYQ
jgi:hypothetical protein